MVKRRRTRASGLRGTPSEHEIRGRALAESVRHNLARSRKRGESRAVRCGAAADAAIAAGQASAEAYWSEERGAGLLVRRARAAVKKACGCKGR